MSGEHRIEFDAGEVIKPEFSPENDLVALYVSDEGLESIREAVSPAQPEGSSGEQPDATPRNGPESPVEDALPIDSAVLDIGMAVIEMNAYVPAEMRSE